MTDAPTNSLSDALVGAATLLFGEAGTGKTHSLRTYIDAGVTPFIIFLEQGRETLGDLPPGKFHYRYIKPYAANWTQLAQMAKAVNTMSLNTLLTMQDVNKTKYVGFLDIITTFNDFKCDCCGKSWGDVSKWNTDRALCIDGLSGLSDMAKLLFVGMKPVMAQSDWQPAQAQILNLTNAIISDRKCFFTLIAHTEREKDELSGGTIITVKSLGRAIAPDMPRKFSDVISAERVGTKFTWNTAAGNSVTKSRNLPIQAGLEPSFAKLIEGWKAKGGKILPTAG